MFTWKRLHIPVVSSVEWLNSDDDGLRVSFPTVEVDIGNHAPSRGWFGQVYRINGVCYSGDLLKDLLLPLIVPDSEGRLAELTMTDDNSFHAVAHVVERTVLPPQRTD